MFAAAAARYKLLGALSHILFMMAFKRWKAIRLIDR